MSETSQSTPVRLGAGGHWRNWVGNQSFVARHKGEPASEDELAAMVAQAEAEIKAFLKLRMYRHPRVMRVMGDAEQILFDLFARYQKRPDDLPTEWLAPAGGASETKTERARRIGNFIAGMTDRFAITEHQRLFDSTLDLR